MCAEHINYVPKNMGSFPPKKYRKLPTFELYYKVSYVIQLLGLLLWKKMYKY